MDALHRCGWSYTWLYCAFLRAGLLQFAACMAMCVCGLVHAGVTGGVRGEEDIDPLRTPWVYYESSD
ncbi:MAG: hypothetical protein PVG72_01080, partial [Gammaproteobacteria bacterium]